MNEITFQRNVLYNPTDFRVVDLDFETRSLVDVTKVGSKVYSEHESTEVLVIQMSVDNGPMQLLLPNWLKEHFGGMSIKILRHLAADPEVFFRAHNSQFEYDVYHNVLMRDYPELPEIPINRWICTQVIAGRSGFPVALDKCMEALRAPLKKMEVGKTLINKFSKPHTRKDKSLGVFNDPRQSKFRCDFELFIKYCDYDVKCQQYIANTLPPLSKYEISVYHMIETYNQRGVPMDMKMVRGAHNLANLYKRKHYVAAEELALEVDEDLESFNINAPGQINHVLELLGVEMAGLTKDLIRDELLDNQGMDKRARRLLELRQGFAKTSCSKYKKALQITSENTLAMHGCTKAMYARTGRNVARMFQTQNLPRGDLPKGTDKKILRELIRRENYDSIEWLYGDVLNACASMIRGSIYAPKGKIFIDADYSQIECRLAFWYAGEEKALDVFRQHGDLYLDTAKIIFSDNTLTKDKNPIERYIGKTAVLQLIYAAGHKSFREYILRESRIDIDEPNEEGVVIGSKHVVDTFRKTYGKVKKAWNDCDRALCVALENQGKRVKAMRGKVVFWYDGKHAYVQLPSKRVITFPWIKFEYKETPWGSMKLSYEYMVWKQEINKWVYNYAHGGIIFQNIVQATNGDVNHLTGLRLEENKFFGLFPVHDEIMVLTNRNNPRFELFKKIFNTSPSWLDGNFPLESEAKLIEAFEK